MKFLNLYMTALFLVLGCANLAICEVEKNNVPTRLCYNANTLHTDKAQINLLKWLKADQAIRLKIDFASADQYKLLIDEIRQLDECHTNLLASEKSLTPNFLSELLFDALIMSNGPCNPEDLKFSCNIYAIIKLLVEQGANLDLEVNYLSPGLLGECVDQCGHGTQEIVCSIRQFVDSSDYRVETVKELFKVNNNI